ncbi:MAG: phosphopentomutase [Fimbriimonadaceae bacterium]|nr:phosphopentomutase [Fimbriimonadaceae bacterium]NUM39446.1 phosphopentomutase [Armatimonadota bacterium]
MKRAIVVVLDGCGAGVAPDAKEFGDPGEPSTLLHTFEAVGGFQTPALASCGFLAAAGIASPDPGAGLRQGWGVEYGRLQPLSKGGKDSVVGHWEMMGIVLPHPFPTYPNGFPISLIKAFERRIETQTLGNRPASGTKIIDDLGSTHMDTGFPIVYTSADSVFQIACHEAVVPVERLYEYCHAARELCVEPNNVQRVIARPFVGDPKAGFQRTERRKDFPVPPPENLVDLLGDVYGIGVVPELFTGRGFRAVERTQSNHEHRRALFEALRTDARFLFANFEDFDMLYGHRNDPVGFARCLEEFDCDVLAPLLEELAPDDLLILTADHGNDPTDESTDHTREYVPGCFVSKGRSSHDYGDLPGFSEVGRRVAEWLGVELQTAG